MRKIALATVLTGLIVMEWSDSASAEERTFELTYVAELDVPEGASKLQMWIPYPNSDDYQDVRLVSIDAPVPTKLYQEYTYRNSMLFLSTSAAELESIRVETRVRVTRREHVERDFIEIEDPEGYLESSARRWLRPRDESMVERAEELTEAESTISGKARSLYDAVVDDWGTDESFLALCRAAGIPARAATGFRLPRARGEGDIAGPSRWVSFYVPGYGWVPVDTVAARESPERRDYYFGAHDENRVEFTVGRDIRLNPQQAGKPLSPFIYPYAEIDGEPASDIRAQFHYKDLERVAE